MINFIKFKYLYFLISAIFIVPGLISLALYGLKPGIDFTGGSLIELQITPKEGATINEHTISDVVSTLIPVSSIQPSKDSYIIRSKSITPDQNQQLQTALTDQLGAVNEIRFDTVGPTLGAELLRKTLYAVILASLAILIYVAHQFNEIKYGICAVLAMFHDTFLLIGVFSLLGHFYGIEVDTLFVTAVLTILSFSVHDTIVVYDRIRETLRRNAHATYTQIVNKAINETLGRSVNNSMTIIFMLTALYLLGGPTIKWFIFALLIGTITGTYSSTFTASPLLVVWEDLSRRRSAKK